MGRIFAGTIFFAAWLPAIPVSAQAAGPTPAIELSVASRGISKGLRQTKGPQFLFKPQIGLGAFYAGGQIKNVDGAPDGEAAAFAGAKTKLLGFDADASLSYKFLVGIDGPATDTGALEVAGSLGRKFGPIAGRLSLTYSPDDLGSTGESAYFLAGATASLTPTTTISAAIGRRERAGGPDYTAFNVGASQAVGKHVSLDLRYHDTAESSLGEVYRGRVVASARLKF